MEHQLPILAKDTGPNPMRAALSLLSTGRIRAHSAILCVLLLFGSCAVAQSAPASPDHPWHGVGEQRIEAEGKNSRESSFSIDPIKSYSLAELIDLAETHNPETQVAWERARAQAAALGVARSELFPPLTAAALSQTSRQETYLGTRYYRQTFQDFQGALDLNYTVFDFGARAGRIDAAKAEVLAANFAFNDTHRRVIYEVEQAYYQILNASGQEDAARASLSNAQGVQQSAEVRLNNGLATLPDVLEARSATAQAEYELQTALGAEETAQGDLATALGTSPTATIHTETLKELPIPDSMVDSVDLAINRAFAQRPDLMRLVSEIKSSNAKVKEARAAFYPSLDVNVNPVAQSLYGLQQTLKEQKGNLDIIFANAGTGEFAPLGQISEEHFDKQFDVNVKGTLFTVQKALPLLRPGRSIVLNASIVSSTGSPAFSIYSATKAAVRSFARTWSVDLKKRKIRVNAISPGIIPTPGYNTSLGMTQEQVDQFVESSIANIPLGRPGTADEIAKAVVFLASDDGSYITGIELFVDGGLTQI